MNLLVVELALQVDKRVVQKPVLACDMVPFLFPRRSLRGLEPGVKLGVPLRDRSQLAGHVGTHELAAMQFDPLGKVFQFSGDGLSVDHRDLYPVCDAIG